MENAVVDGNALEMMNIFSKGNKFHRPALLIRINIIDRYVNCYMNLDSKIYLQHSCILKSVIDYCMLPTLIKISNTKGTIAKGCRYEASSLRSNQIK